MLRALHCAQETQDKLNKEFIYFHPSLQIAFCCQRFPNGNLFSFESAELKDHYDSGHWLSKALIQKG